MTTIIFQPKIHINSSMTGEIGAALARRMAKAINRELAKHGQRFIRRPTSTFDRMQARLTRTLSGYMGET